MNNGPKRMGLSGKLVIVLSIILSVNTINAQQFIMSNDAVTTCNGLFYDSGVLSNYSNNESFVYTICPGIPGDVIQLAFNSFNLTGIDEMFVYDGNSIAAPVLPGGPFTGTSLAGLVIEASIANTSGCLTFQFISDGSGTAPGWEAQISCSTPCVRPVAIASSTPQAFARVCVGDVINFDGSASTVAPGFNIVDYTWDFADGTTASGALASHSYSDPGEYIVQLYLMDNIGCSSTNAVDLVFWVGTEPTFNGTTADTSICLGETVCLDGAVTGTEWNGIPPNLVAGTTALPDGNGVSYTTSIPVLGFTPGSTIGSALDIVEICMTIEHSYLGDLDIVLECPNGTQVVLFETFGNGGGGTYLGDPIDNNTGTPGIGWTYCFSEVGTFGTMVAENNLNNYQMSTLTPGNSMTPGNYTVEGTYSDFIGCDLNGNWSLIITDNIGIDDGFIFDWSITFAPSLYPSITSFTPVYGAQSDSSGWSGPDIVSATADSNNVCVQPSALGTFDYQYSATDNFGCTYDTTITVTVTPGPEVDAGPDQVICSDSLQLDATIIGMGPPPGPCDYQLELYDSFGDGWDGASIDLFINGVPTNYTFTNGSQADFVITVNNGDLIEIQYNTGAFENEHTYAFFDPNGTSIFSDGPSPTPGMVFTINAVCGPAAASYDFSWSPTTGLSDPSIADPMAYTTITTMYYITVFEIGHPDCAHTDSLTITLDPALNPGEDTLVIVCASDPIFNLIDVMGGNPDPGGVWTDTLGNPVASTFDPSIQPNSFFTYTVTTTLGCIGSADLEVQVLPLGDPACCGIPEAGPDNLSCNLNYTMNATPGNIGVGLWTGPAGATFSDPADTNAIVTMDSGGTYMFYWIEDDNITCYVLDSVLITFTDPIFANLSITDAVCFDACDGTVLATPIGGNVSGPYTYAWSNGLTGPSDDSAVGICDGNYSVTITDDNNCSMDTSFVINEPPPMVIDAIQVIDETCYSDCDGQVEVLASTAVQYSFDGGSTFTPNGLLTDQCVGFIDIMVQDIDGCLAVGNATIGGPPEVEAEFTYSPQPANVIDPTVSFFNSSFGATSYLWDLGGLGTSNAYQPVFEFPSDQPGEYNVCLTAFNPNGCSHEVCMLVVVEDELIIYVPNSFSPNGDGTNEGFGPSFSIAIANYEMLVFDRWGSLVYETNDPYQPWSGAYRNNGEAMAEGVYAWKIRVQDAITGLKKELLGHVTLLK